jgi:hypothetical protein
MDRYAHVGIRDTAAALARLPVPSGLMGGSAPQPAVEPHVLKATGTDRRSTSDAVPGAVPDAVTTGKGRLRVRTVEETSDEGGRKNSLGNKGVEDEGGESESGEEKKYTQ